MNYWLSRDVSKSHIIYHIGSIVHCRYCVLTWLHPLLFEFMSPLEVPECAFKHGN